MRGFFKIVTSVTTGEHRVSSFRKKNRRNSVETAYYVFLTLSCLFHGKVIGLRKVAGGRSLICLIATGSTFENISFRKSSQDL